MPGKLLNTLRLQPITVMPIHDHASWALSVTLQMGAPIFGFGNP
jgi:hypothetical protein